MKRKLSDWRRAKLERVIAIRNGLREIFHYEGCEETINQRMRISMSVRKNEGKNE